MSETNAQPGGINENNDVNMMDNEVPKDDYEHGSPCTVNLENVKTPNNKKRKKDDSVSADDDDDDPSLSIPVEKRDGDSDDNEDEDNNVADSDKKFKSNVETPNKRRRKSNGKSTTLSARTKKTLREVHKRARQSILDQICEIMQSDDNIKVSQILEEFKTDHPWLTRFIIYRAQEKLKAKMQLQAEEESQRKTTEDLSNGATATENTVGDESMLSPGADDQDMMSPDSLKREGRKKGKKGGPRRRFATLYNMPDGAEHAVDVTRVCHSASFLNKLKRTEKKFLADAYQQMNDAKQEFDDAKTVLEQYQSEHQRQLQVLASMEEKIQSQIESVKIKEESIQKASDYVTEQELKVECPWNNNYRKLCEYKELHGNIDLPTRCQEDKEMDSLCCWVQAQKQKYQDYREGCKNTFKPHRILLLEKLGIEWNVRNNLWNKHFETLVKFKEEFGHVVVPTKTPPPAYKELAAWVVYQRDQYKSILDETVRKRRPVKPAISLTPDRIQKLKDIGFVFNVFDERWDAMYLELKNSNRNYASFKKTNPKLHHWMQRQRYQYELYHTGQRQTKRCRLTAERIKMLDDLEFPWRISDETTFDEPTTSELTPAVEPESIQNVDQEKIEQDHMFFQQYPSTRIDDHIQLKQSTEQESV